MDLMVDGNRNEDNDFLVDNQSSAAEASWGAVCYAGVTCYELRVKHRKPTGMMQTIGKSKMEVISERFIYYSSHRHVNRCIELHVQLINCSIVVLMLCANVFNVMVMLMFL